MAERVAQPCAAVLLPWLQGPTWTVYALIRICGHKVGVADRLICKCMPKVIPACVYVWCSITKHAGGGGSVRAKGRRALALQTFSLLPSC